MGLHLELTPSPFSVVDRSPPLVTSPPFAPSLQFTRRSWWFVRLATKKGDGESSEYVDVYPPYPPPPPEHAKLNLKPGTANSALGTVDQL